MFPVVLIPIVEPRPETVAFIQRLTEVIPNPLVIVDDGSGESFQERFSLMAKFRQAITVLSYEHNQGKGHALKFGLRYIQKNYPTTSGVVTADGDGQHSITDIRRMLAQIPELDPQHLLLGIRSFDIQSTPKKSYWGNRLTSLFYFAATGIHLGDTQTGLRGFRFSKISELLMIEGDRFEYEMNVLLQLGLLDMSIQTIPIATIYEENNAHSHFRAFEDSYLIYRPLLSFLLSSIASAAVDLSLFFLLSLLFEQPTASNLLIITIAARFASGIFNYFLNKQWVFRDTKAVHRSVWKYGILFAAQLTLSWLGVTLLSNAIASLLVVKIIVDTILFLFSFFIQKRFVFTQ